MQERIFDEALPVRVTDLPLNSGALSTRNGQKFLVDFKYLFLEQLLRFRTSWPYTLSMTLIFPFLILFGFGRIGGLMTQPQGLIYVVAGSTVYAMVMESGLMLAQHVATLKHEGYLLYYASLPISKTAFVLALLTSRILLVGLPSMLTPLILGPLFYHLEWQWTMSWLILLLPLTAFSLAVGGMFLGLALENQDLLNLVSTIGTCLIFLASPIFIPLEALPLPLQILSFLLPPSYAADAMRHAFASTIGWEFYADLIMLLLFAGVSSIGIHKFLRWRI